MGQSFTNAAPRLIAMVCGLASRHRYAPTWSSSGIESQVDGLERCLRSCFWADYGWPARLGRFPGMVKRIRRNGSVTVAPYDFRGNAHGEAIPGRATLTDPATGHHIRNTPRKYGLLERITTLASRIRRGGTVPDHSASPQSPY